MKTTMKYRWVGRLSGAVLTFAGLLCPIIVIGALVMVLFTGTISETTSSILLTSSVILLAVSVLVNHIPHS